jgi:hypothetical protein
VIPIEICGALFELREILDRAFQEDAAHVSRALEGPPDINIIKAELKASITTDGYLWRGTWRDGDGPHSNRGSGRVCRARLPAGHISRSHRGTKPSMSAETDKRRWESLAAKYLRRLAAEDMRQWLRHYRSEDRSTAPVEHQAADGVLSMKERNRRKLMRVTSRAAYIG